MVEHLKKGKNMDTCTHYMYIAWTQMYVYVFESHTLPLSNTHEELPTWSPQSPTPRCSTWLYTCARRPAGSPARHPLGAGWWPSRLACCGTSTGGCRILANALYGSPEQRIQRQWTIKHFQKNIQIRDPGSSPAHSLLPCRLVGTPPCCSLAPTSKTCQ